MKSHAEMKAFAEKAPKYSKIPLTKGKFAVVDTPFVPFLKLYNWWAIKARTGNYYAYTQMYLGGKKRQVSMHQFLTGVKNMCVDHMNHDGLDNRLKNLRLCTLRQNIFNSRLRAKNKVGYKGVNWRKRDNLWSAKISHNQKQIFLGNYKTVEEAAKAYDVAAKKYRGEFACLNFPEKLNDDLLENI